MVGAKKDSDDGDVVCPICGGLTELAGHKILTLSAWIADLHKSLGIAMSIAIKMAELGDDPAAVTCLEDARNGNIGIEEAARTLDVDIPR
jgi:hypothetical protein